MSHPSKNEGKPAVAGFFVGIGFLICAGMFMLGDTTVDIPLHKQSAVDASQIVPGIHRAALSEPPMINIGTLNQRCNDCHSLFENTRDDGRALTQHTDIRLEHGLNDGCLNCHDKDNRERLALMGGKSVGFGHVEQLCSQCHGPIFRDWQNRTHGKTIGYWDSNLGESKKLVCTECHDPHHPAYQPMEPLPGPNTLRMGDQHQEHEMIDSRNPLQRWRLNEHSDSSENEHGGHDE
jgi:hypothetical protein